MTETQDTRVHAVVINHEEQYSIWPVERALPAGWRQVGITGTEAECLEYIDQTWTDMRPLSLHNWMRDHEQSAGN
ncbi:MAG TPA: MbtH family protein [Jatrophihabitans sp.]|nr:MbtH family protein [Jatrophihabitans sp.]